MTRQACPMRKKNTDHCFGQSNAIDMIEVIIYLESFIKIYWIQWISKIKSYLWAKSFTSRKPVVLKLCRYQEKCEETLQLPNFTEENSLLSETLCPIHCFLQNTCLEHCKFHSSWLLNTKFTWNQRIIYPGTRSRFSYSIIRHFRRNMISKVHLVGPLVLMFCLPMTSPWVSKPE